MDNVITVSTLFQRYLDLYRVSYNYNIQEVSKFYSEGLWRSYTTKKDASIAYNIILTPDMSVLPPQIRQKEITENKILVLVVYFDDIAYYQQNNSKNKRYSLYVNAFIDHFYSEIKKEINNENQRNHLNILRYTEHTKQEHVDDFLKRMSILKRKM